MKLIASQQLTEMVVECDRLPGPEDLLMMGVFGPCRIRGAVVDGRQVWAITSPPPSHAAAPVLTAPRIAEALSTAYGSLATTEQLDAIPAPAFAELALSVATAAIDKHVSAAGYPAVPAPPNPDPPTLALAPAGASKFRKKPVVISAEQFYPDREPWPAGVLREIRPADHGSQRRGFDTVTRYVVKTLEGEHIASPGDWIITGVKGERYPSTFLRRPTNPSRSNPHA